MKDLTPLDEIITGRVEPHIYAFSTAAIPGYLKVGDTYRPVKVRLEEWRKKYADLQPEFESVAKVDEGVFFRDYAVHQYLEHDLDKPRLTPEALPDNIYYSNEFFQNTTLGDVTAAMDDIKADYRANSMRYQFYDVDKLPAKTRYKSTGIWQPRPNQQKVIDKFKTAYTNGRTNLLLYAVMRFGKTFTAMCCAKEMDAKVVLTVSAKKDVQDEWRKTIESAENFQDFVFATSSDLNADADLIKNTLRAGKRIAIFATLQELQGDVIKEKHKELFAGQIDLLLIDETHFGARAEKYSKAIRDDTPREVGGEKKEDFVDAKKADQQLKRIRAKVRIHLSGTPYRILMSQEFQPEDIIGFYQASDIVQEKEAWDAENLLDEKYEEWDNPYFGYPQMVRFAFTPSQKMRAKMELLKQNGAAYGLSDLLQPLSTGADATGNYQKFKYADEVLELLRVIDGSAEDAEILSLLDYDKIKSGKLCRHMVMVLPFRASCDAMEQLIKDHAKDFRNLSEYEIINISGFDTKYSIPEIKNRIKEAEKQNRKTLTLTVNRMLTGSTVEEWDTMIYLKNSASAQEYDQAIFRLQNQFVTDATSTTGEIIKYNKKPQTLLVDFDPNRVFRMQEERSLYYNAGENTRGRGDLEAQIATDLRISPIIVMNQNKIHQVEAPELMAAIDNYSKNRGIYDEAQEIPVDLGLLTIDAVRAEIEKQGDFKSRNGFELTYGDDDDDFAVPDDEVSETTPAPSESAPENNSNKDTTEKDLKKQFRAYYSRILFYAALVEEDVESLKSIINSLDETPDHRRIAKNLGLDKTILETIHQHIDFFALHKLDNTISRINRLSNDKTLSPLERARTAISKFDRLSDSEVITPQLVCRKVLETIGAENLVRIIKDGKLVLDIACKEAEFALALADILAENGVDLSEYANNIYAIPTSGIAYEFTRKIYTIMGLNINNISANQSAYNLVDIQKAQNKVKCFLNEAFGRKDDEMEFDVIVGNPPYQLTGGSGGNADAPIYQHFAEAAMALDPQYCALIVPSKWFSGGRESLLGDFRKHMLSNRHLKTLVVYSDPKDVFDSVAVKGGVCYYLIDRDYEGDCEYTLNYHIGNTLQTETSSRKLNQFEILIREPVISDVVQKVVDVTHAEKGKFVNTIISNDTPFGISSNPKGAKKKQNAIDVADASDSKYTIKLFYIEKNKRRIGYVKRADIKKNADKIDDYKVFIPGGYGAGDGFPHQILGIPEYGGADSVCSQSYLYAAFKASTEAQNFITYIRTKFFRALILARKISQSAPRKTYSYVPLQDFTENSDINWGDSIKQIDEYLYKKYGLSKDEIKYIEKIVKDMEV